MMTGGMRRATLHRIRVIDGFEAAGVPLDVLVRAQAAGVISVDYYDQLHAAPGRPSNRDYHAFKIDLGPPGHLLPAMFAAFGIAEPDPASHLSVEDEAFIEDWAALIDATGHADLTLGILRQFGESSRRSSVAALEAYAQVVEQLGPEFAGVPSQEIYDRVFVPWATAARNLPALAEWLTRHHMSRAIDDYSIRATEQVLADSGYVPERPTVEPAVAFLDLTGFTSLTQERGDTIAAEMALRLADLASRAVATHGGRVVKLLGDGVLMHFPDVVEAVEAALDLMDRLGAVRPATRPRRHHPRPDRRPRRRHLRPDRQSRGADLRCGAEWCAVRPGRCRPSPRGSLRRRAGRCDHAPGRGHRRVGTRRGAQNVASNAAAHRRGVVGAPESDRWCTRATADQYEGAILAAGP